MLVQLNYITESGVGIRHRLALPKHCWSLQQTWRDQEVLGIKRLNPTNLQLLRYDVREGGTQRRPVAELVWVEESKVSDST